mmetsp:Transcript_36569/g.85703  ORF Transcript_36569/g.85703 Transcript_36569/m.85703 type:complete len:230 (-) Transcript_36569:1124-1813(-)
MSLANLLQEADGLFQLRLVLRFCSATGGSVGCQQVLRQGVASCRQRKAMLVTFLPLDCCQTLPQQQLSPIIPAHLKVQAPQAIEELHVQARVVMLQLQCQLIQFLSICRFGHCSQQVCQLHGGFGQRALATLAHALPQRCSRAEHAFSVAKVSKPMTQDPTILQCPDHVLMLPYMVVLLQLQIQAPLHVSFGFLWLTLKSQGMHSRHSKQRGCLLTRGIALQAHAECSV